MAYLLGKLAWALARPSNLLLLLAAAGLLRQLATRRRRGFAALAAAVLLLAAAAVLPLGRWLARPLEDRFAAPAVPPERVDGVVVLGGSFATDVAAARGAPALGPAAERLTALVELARRYPGARILFTGGDAGLVPRGVTEAALARSFLASQGVPAGRVEYEDRARSTRDNAALTLPLAAPRPGEVWLLVTSANHMARAMGAFRRAGWPEPVPWPVDHRTTGREPPLAVPALGERLAELDDAAYEWWGLLYYRALGYTDEVLPGPRPPPA